jgi:hypothetical protein
MCIYRGGGHAVPSGRRYSKETLTGGFLQDYYSDRVGSSVLTKGNWSMKKKFNLLLCCSVSILLSACASAPTEEQLRNADYGSYQSPATCVQLVEARIRATMKDPYGAQFNHGSCIKGWVSSVPIMGLPVAFGYYQTGSVNGKNSYGGYVGFRPYLALVRDGRVIRYCVTDNEGLCIPAL